MQRLTGRGRWAGGRTAGHGSLVLSRDAGHLRTDVVELGREGGGAALRPDLTGCRHRPCKLASAGRLSGQT
jgi:hypothetical protein